MSERKSTPVPWSLLCSEARGRPRCLVVLEDNGNEVAAINTHLTEWNENAVLIVSAPELAEALRELHDFAAVDSFDRYEERSRAAFTRAGELLKRVGY